MYFIIGLPILIDWKRYNYDAILIIVDRFLRMVDYKPVKITINAAGLAKVIIDIVVKYYGFHMSIVSQ